MAGDLNLRLVLKFLDEASPGLARFAEKVSAVTRASGLMQVGAAAAGIGRQFAAVGGAASQLASNIDNVANRTQNLLFRYGALLGGTGYAFKKFFLDVATQSEDLSLALEGLLGSKSKAKDALAWISNFARSTPLTLGETGEAFKRLLAYGIDPMAGHLKAVMDAVSKLGGKSPDVMEAIIQIGQAWQKNVLEMQDVRPLQNIGVPVLQILSDQYKRMTGKTISTDELAKLQGQARLKRPAIMALLRGMEIWAPDAAQKRMKTFTGMMSNVSDDWQRFARRVMETGGLFDWMKGKLSDLLSWYDRMEKSGQMDVWARQIGIDLKHGFLQAYSAAKQIFLGLREVGEALSWLADKVGGWRNLVIGLAALMATSLAVSIVQTAISVWRLAAAITTGLIPALIRLGVALLTTPVGWFLLAVTGIALLAYIIYENWGPLKAWFAKLWKQIQADFKTAWATWKARLESLNPLPAIQDMVRKVEDFLGKLDWTDLAKRVFQTFLSGLVPDFSGLLPQTYGAWRAQMEARAAGAASTALVPGRASIFDQGGARRDAPEKGRVDIHLHNTPPGTRVRNDSGLNLLLHPGLGQPLVTP